MKLKIKPKTMLSIAEVLAWLLISAGVCLHIYGLKTDCPNTAIFVKC